MSAKEDFDRHHSLSHAMQSGVAMKMNYDSSETSPKHLRVGVNVAMRDHSSLVALLIEKGIVSEDEYAKAIADGMEAEVQMYERELEKRFGQKVTIRLG